MKSSIFQKSFQRGFTLIELMIVIVILGILMGTLLPRLSGSQARARDAGRMMDLNNISQAIQLYYNDFGSLPGAGGVGTMVCVDKTAGGMGASFATYFKEKDIPKPPKAGENIVFPESGTAAACPNAYGYVPLMRNETKSAYALIANMEAETQANYYSGGGISLTTTTDVTAVRSILDGVNKTSFVGDDNIKANLKVYVKLDSI